LIKIVWKQSNEIVVKDLGLFKKDVPREVQNEIGKELLMNNGFEEVKEKEKPKGGK